MPKKVKTQAKRWGAVTALGLSTVGLPHAAGGEENLFPQQPSETGQQAVDQAQTRASIKALVPDLRDHPMAGGVVSIQLCFEDALGGRDCDTVEAELPYPQLNNPIGYQVQALRRELAIMVEQAERGEDGKPLDSALKQGGTEVSESFNGFLNNYSTDFQNPTTLLHIMNLQYDLQQDSAQSDLAGLENILTELRAVTLQLEKDIMSPAQRALQEAREALQEALERGADDPELQELNEQMLEALQGALEEQSQDQELSLPEQQALKDMQELMKRLKEMLEEMGITPEEFAKMMQEMAQGLSSGAPPESGAQQQDLEQMLENLREQIEMMQKLHKYMSDLREITQEQQEIRDQTLSEALRQQDGAERKENAPAPETLESRQENLKNRFKDLLDDMGEDDLSFDSLNKALREMGEAETDLENDRTGRAVEDQDQALDALRQSSDSLQGMMMQIPGSGYLSGYGPGSGAPESSGGTESIIDKKGRLRDSQNNNKKLGVNPNPQKRSRDIRDDILERRNHDSEGSEYYDRLLKGPE